MRCPTTVDAAPWIEPSALVPVGAFVNGRNTFEKWRRQERGSRQALILEYVLAHQDDAEIEDRWRTRMVKRLTTELRKQRNELRERCDEQRQAINDVQAALQVVGRSTTDVPITAGGAAAGSAEADDEAAAPGGESLASGEAASAANAASAMAESTSASAAVQQSARVSLDDVVTSLTPDMQQKIKAVLAGHGIDFDALTRQKNYDGVAFAQEFKPLIYDFLETDYPVAYKMVKLLFGEV